MMNFEFRTPKFYFIIQHLPAGRLVSYSMFDIFNSAKLNLMTLAGGMRLVEER
jgi:hypothetical protein